MPAVRFYTGLADRPGFAARLLRKAVRQDLKVWVVGEESELRQISQRLWGLPGFAAHALPGATAGLQRRSPLRLSTGFAADADCTALLNLSAAFPPELARWQHVFELVGVDAEAVQQGRSRFKAYRAQGCVPEHFEAEGA